MHQICDGYNPKVRMGNWFQESYSVSQPWRTNPQKKSRQSEIDIGYIDAHLKLRPLNRCARMPQWNTTGLVEAPQFKQMTHKTTAKQNYDVGVVGHFFKDWKPTVYNKNTGSTTQNESNVKINKCKREFKMFNEHNINELINERQSDQTSFKSSLVPNRHIQPQTLLQTIYQRDISDKNAGINTFTGKTKGPVLGQVQKPAFRRIRSEITMRNIATVTTNK